MEQLLVNRCDFCMHRNGMVCTVSHRDCKPGIEPCPYEDEKLYPCKYKATDSVRRYLGNLGVRTEIKDKTPDYERVEEAEGVLMKALDEKEDEQRVHVTSLEKFEATNVTKQDEGFHDEFTLRKPRPMTYSFNPQNLKKIKVLPQVPRSAFKSKCLGRLLKLFKK